MKAKVTISSSVNYKERGSLLLTGGLKVDLEGCAGGDDGAKLKLVCGVSGVIEAAMVRDECVEGGV